MKTRFFVSAAVLSSSLVAASSFAHEPGLAFTIVDYPGATSTAISAVNDHGQVVGQFTHADGVGHAFHGKPGHLVPVDPNGPVGKSAFSAAYTLNNLGVIGGSLSSDPSLGRGDHGFLVRDGQVTILQYPGAFPTEVYGVNDLDQVIGGYFAADGSTHAFAWERGLFKPEDVPGALSTVPLTINDRGVIVGFYVTEAGTTGHGYVREPNGAIQTFDAPGAAPSTTQLLYINNRDDMLGSYVDGSGALVNFLRVRHQIEILTAPASLGASATFFQAINDAGELAGFFADATALHGFLATPTH